MKQISLSLLVPVRRDTSVHYAIKKLIGAPSTLVSMVAHVLINRLFINASVLLVSKLCCVDVNLILASISDFQFQYDAG